MEILLALTGVAAALALHYFLARRRQTWLGAVVPILWAAAVVVLFMRGQMNRVIDYVMAVAGMIFLLGILSDGHKARRTRGSTQ